nr:hypothetical protein CFP56_59633 [Quercus suber]
MSRVVWLNQIVSARREIGNSDFFSRVLGPSQKSAARFGFCNVEFACSEPVRQGPQGCPQVSENPKSADDHHSRASAAWDREQDTGSQNSVPGTNGMGQRGGSRSAASVALELRKSQESRTTADHLQGYSMNGGNVQSQFVHEEKSGSVMHEKLDGCTPCYIPYVPSSRL